MNSEPIVHLVPVSGNGKTGPIAVSMTEQSSCPETCGFKGNGCYAAYGHTLLHWRKVPERGLPWRDFIRALRQLPQHTFFRHNVAGDLPHAHGYLIPERVIELARVAAHFAASWTYTHHRLNKHNLDIIREAIAYGFTINVSCEDPHTAALNHLRGLPTVCAVPGETPPCFRAEGVTFVQCPATLRDDINCKNCGGARGIPLCARSDRSCVVTFPVHGPGRRKAEAVTRAAAA